MVTSDEPSARRGTDRATRVRIGLQVASALALAIAAVGLVTWLAERRGLRLRLDWTANQRSTLSPATLDALAKLEAPVDIDIFFRPGEGLIAGVVDEAQVRTMTLLVVARDSSGGNVRLTQYDTSDGLGGLARTQSRMRELRLNEIEPGGVVVVSQGERRVPLRLRGDLADLDPGNPTGRDGPATPARIVSFRGEEALAAAVLKVVDGATRKIVFLTGHGERDLAGTDDRGLALLAHELESDGFEVETRKAGADEPLPADCAVLAWIGPEQPLSEAEFDAVGRFVESGGALVMAPGLGEIAGPTSLPALAARFGIRVDTRGFLARALVQASGGEVVSDAKCAVIFVGGAGLSAQPITDGLRRADRHVVLFMAKSLDVGTPPPGGVVLPLLRTSEDCWRDLPTVADPRVGDWVPDAREPRGPFIVGIEAKFSPLRSPVETRIQPVGVRPESRVVCLGSAEAFGNMAFETNRDLLLSVFNHAAAREFRVSVVKRSADAHRIDLASGRALPTVTAVAVIALPGACLLLGLFMAWRRRH